MDLDGFPHGAVMFELGDQYAAHHLCETLWRRWESVVQHGDAIMFVTVALPQEPRDLDDLLRTVEDWLDRRGLPLIRFHLEGRLYVLQRGGHLAPAGPRDFARVN